MPWKNGLGISYQIDIEPDTTNFIYRLSMAFVQEASDFSIYSGYTRLLSVWQGQGLLLNSESLDQYEIIEFSGETPISCEVKGSNALDLGLIFDREFVQAEMKFFTEGKTLHLKEGLHYLFCAQGSFTSHNFLVETGDTLKIQGPSHSVDIVKNHKFDLKYYLISIYSRY